MRRTLHAHVSSDKADTIDGDKAGAAASNLTSLEDSKLSRCKSMIAMLSQLQATSRNSSVRALKQIHCLARHGNAPVIVPRQTVKRDCCPIVQSRSH